MHPRIYSIPVVVCCLLLSVGLMTLLMVATVIYLPIVLPLLLPGVTVDPLEVASSLVVLMLIPLAVGLLVHARWGDVAEYLKPKMAQASKGLDA